MHTEVPRPSSPTLASAADESRLTLAGHLEELRHRLGISLLAFLLAMGVGMAQAERLIGWLQQPAAHLLPRFAFFSPAEPLLAYLKVAALAGFLLAMPVLLSQVWGFVRSGLTKRERWQGLVFIGWGSFQFIAGVAFAYYLMMPVSLQFLLGIGKAFLEPVISIDAYLSFATTLLFWCGLVFEVPVALFFLARVGIVTPEWLRQQRPYAILVLVIVAAVVTPTTDPINLLLLALPLSFLYEASIWIAHLAMRGQRSV